MLGSQCPSPPLSAELLGPSAATLVVEAVRRSIVVRVVLVGTLALHVVLVVHVLCILLGLKRVMSSRTVEEAVGQQLTWC